MFKTRFSQTAVRFQIYGCARKDVDGGRKFMSSLLLNSITCSDEPCRKLKIKFAEATQYHRLKTERDFKELSEKLYENTQSMYGLMGSPVTLEQGRLIYMSIPPSTYSKTALYVDKYLRPKVGRPWFRVVLEKPFGHDLESAQKLSDQLTKYFNESEVYRVDHYLGKTVVKQILPFRYLNKAEFEPLWNKDHIQQVDIVMKERDDVAGRTDFYNEVGIIRDVVQNHLTEMFALIAMDLPENSGNISAILESKLQVLHHVRCVKQDATLTAQYTTYNSEWMKNENKNFSHMPTFSATALFVDNARWSGVPFLLMSGKKLEDKSSYVRIRFRNARFCMRLTDESCDWQKQVVFHIGGGSNLKLPAMIAVSRGLPVPRLQAGWNSLPSPVESPEGDVNLFGQSVSQMNRFVPDVEKDPYTELLGAVMDGIRSLFTSVDGLLASWRIWTPVLRLTEEHIPRQYVGRGRDPERLDFVVTSRGLQWQLNDRDILSHESPTESRQMYADVPTTFRNEVLVAGTTKVVVKQLAVEISKLIQEAQSNKKPFHLALSGGSSSIPLFDALSEVVHSWSDVHLWLVDERCVPTTSDQLNFNLLQQHLLNWINVLHMNVHPMLTDVTGYSCLQEADYSADRLYETILQRLVPSETLDYVVLGVGPDGHTASLFPGDGSLAETERLAVFSKTSSVDDTTHNRITLTLKTINKAKNIAILVLGEAKNSILKTVSDVDDVNKYPITGVSPVNGVMKWFVDYDALFAKDGQ